MKSVPVDDGQALAKFPDNQYGSFDGEENRSVHGDSVSLATPVSLALVKRCRAGLVRFPG